MIKTKNILACVILVGGKGSRLDGDGKYNQKIDKHTLLEHVYNRLKNQFNLVAININNKNRKITLKLEIILDQFSNNVGPLAGIHAALIYGTKKLGKEGYVCIVPVDTPFLPNDLAERLYKNIKMNNSEVVFAKSGNRIHPTIGIWRNNLLSKLEDNINKGVRKIDLFTSNLKVSYEEWKVQDIDPFYNINS